MTNTDGQDYDDRCRLLNLKLEVLTSTIAEHERAALRAKRRRAVVLDDLEELYASAPSL